MELSSTLKEKFAAIKLAFPEGKSALIPALHALQDELGSIPLEMEIATADYFQIPVENVHEATTFYTMIQRSPVGKNLICVCGNLSCWLRGYEQIRQHLEQKLGIRMGQTTPDGKFTLNLVECLGMCDHAPVIQVNGAFHSGMTPEKIDQFLATLERGAANE